MEDDDFLRLYGDYLEPPGEPNKDMEDVEIEWIRGDPDIGSLKMWEKHKVTEEEVKQVLLEVPPEVEAKRHPQFPDSVYFWGATRAGRQLFIVCDERWEGVKRILTPITAYAPDKGRAYWERQ